MKYYKCVKKTNTNYLHIRGGKLDGSVRGAYCCLESYNDALNLLTEWAADAIECNRPLTYNCILLIEGNECDGGYNGLCCPNTKFVERYTVLKELYQIAEHKLY